MGCSGSTQAHSVQAPAVPTPSAPPLKDLPPGTAESSKGQSKGKGKPGKGTGKGKGKGKGRGGNFKKFQVELSGLWQDYGPEEDIILKQAYLAGQPNCRFFLRGQHYEYSFRYMLQMQKNLDSGRPRLIRPPPGMRAPKEPLLPAGPMLVLLVPPGGGDSMEIADPNNPGSKIIVAIPPQATPGTRICVPIPEEGQKVEEVVKKQKTGKTGAKVAAGAAAVGALAVGGVVLGEHLSGGAVSEWAAGTGSPELAAAGDWVAEAADWGAVAAADAGDWAADAAGEVGAWAEGAGEWTVDAVGDAGDWAEGAADAVGGWGVGAADAVADWGAGAGDWLGEAGADVGDFVINLF